MGIYCLVALVHSGSAATTQSDTISSDVVGLPAGLCEIYPRWPTQVVDHYGGLVLCVAALVHSGSVACASKREVDVVLGTCA